MANRPAYVPGIGEVVLNKRRRSKYLRLSVSASGQVRISMPYWVPYAAAIAFAQKRSDWIQKQVEVNKLPLLNHNVRIGKAHRLTFRHDALAAKPTSRIGDTTIEIRSAQPSEDASVQKKALEACEKALKIEADKLLPIRLDELAKKHGFKYKSVAVRKLTSRWGSCSSAGAITLSYFLVQLPWEFIDYVLLHELAHTRYLNHSRDFWTDLNRALPHARSLQKQIRTYRPRVEQL